MVAYVHIEYSTYQFSDESVGEGDGIHPPWSLRYRIKRGPERVKKIQKGSFFPHPLDGNSEIGKNAYIYIRSV